MKALQHDKCVWPSKEMLTHNLMNYAKSLKKLLMEEPTALSPQFTHKEYFRNGEARTEWPMNYGDINDNYS